MDNVIKDFKNAHKNTFKGELRSQGEYRVNIMTVQSPICKAQRKNEIIIT